MAEEIQVWREREKRLNEEEDDKRLSVCPQCGEPPQLKIERIHSLDTADGINYILGCGNQHRDFEKAVFNDYKKHGIIFVIKRLQKTWEEIVARYLDD